jgi:hypothetical protein
MKKVDILAPVVYFDTLDFPLTVLEIWRHQSTVCSLAEVRQAADFLPQQNGYYFLPGRAEIVAKRQERYLLAEQKFRRRRWLIKLLAGLPYVRLVALCNTLSYRNASRQSDIDLFIVTAPQKIWTCRLVVGGLVKLLGLQPRPACRQDKICLAFWVTSEQLALQSVRIDQQDINFLYWLADFVPVYDAGGVFADLVKQNPWLTASLPNWSPKLPAERWRLSLGKWGRQFKRLAEKLLDWPIGEKIAKTWQQKFFPAALQELKNKDTRVVINDQMLKMHVQDDRVARRQLWQERLQSLLTNLPPEQ